MSNPHFLASLSNDTVNGKAREAAINQLKASEATPTSLIAYESLGRVLIIGPRGYALEQAESLPSGLDVTVLLNDTDAPHSSDAPRTVHGTLQSVNGHLGNFEVRCAIANKEQDLGATVYGKNARFDIVLDLNRPPTLRQELLPPGYFAPDRDPDALYKAIAEIPTLIGRFEKPTYLQYDSEICAHGERGVKGCTRCLDVCPSGSLTSLAQRIEIDAKLCHGVGACAAACPTDALTYTYPARADLMGGLRSLILGFIENGGSQPIVLFHQHDSPPEMLASSCDEISERVLPIGVEDVGLVGIDICVLAAAYGAGVIAVLIEADAPPSTRDHIDRQLGYANAAFSALGYDWLSTVVVLGHADLLRAVATSCSPPVDWKNGKFAVFGHKRTTLNLALDHLYEQAPTPTDCAELSAQAPFGAVIIDKDKCTLCMACTSICPTQALQAGSEHPRLSFLENNCVQCGICSTGCPENALSLNARLVLNPELRKRVRTLKEDEPFLCVSCGKPFASRSVIEKMTDKLRSHRMFEGDALKRIEMCEDCRVKDIFFKHQDGA